MAVEQANFFCPVCQKGRLFQWRKGENQINPRFHCAECGHSDETKYLANPNLRSQEAQSSGDGAAFNGDSSPPYSTGLVLWNSFSRWFACQNVQARVVVFLIPAFLFLIAILGIAELVVDRPNKAANATAIVTNSPAPTLSTPSPSTPTPRSPTDEKARAKAYKDGYRIGLTEGRHPDNPLNLTAERLNTFLQFALSDYKPAEPEIWSEGYRKGFRDGYGGK